MVTGRLIVQVPFFFFFFFFYYQEQSGQKKNSIQSKFTISVKLNFYFGITIMGSFLSIILLNKDDIFSYLFPVAFYQNNLYQTNISYHNTREGFIVTGPISSCKISVTAIG